MTAPDYERFTAHQQWAGKKTITGMLRELVPGIPENVTERFPHIQSAHQISTQKAKVQRETGSRIVARSWEGDLWVCRLLSEVA